MIEIYIEIMMNYYIESLEDGTSHGNIDDYFDGIYRGKKKELYLVIQFIFIWIL